MWGITRLKAGQNWSSWSLTRHMGDDSYLLNACYGHRSQSTAAGSEASPRLHSKYRSSAWHPSNNVDMPGGLDAKVSLRTDSLYCFQDCPETSWRESRQERPSRKEFLAGCLDGRSEQHPWISCTRKRGPWAISFCADLKQFLGQLVRCDLSSCTGCHRQKGPASDYVCLRTLNESEVRKALHVHWVLWLLCGVLRPILPPSRGGGSKAR